MKRLPFLLLMALAAAPATAGAAAGGSSWAFEHSDVPVDPEFRFGRLANGMRYVIRRNATPAGTGVVRMDVAAGSLDEEAGEEGFAHFVEHMAFNGSNRVPEGGMIRLLERNGLAFGPDTNAATGFERTLYKLDLPRNDASLLDTALMLMRETASNLTIADDAVARERGVVLSELRDRNTWSWRDLVDASRFFHPRARYVRRFPIGTTQALEQATGSSLRAFYTREYRPQNVTLVVVGDFDVAAAEAAIVRHFGDWQALPVRRQPAAGPFTSGAGARVGLHVDPALSERLTIQRDGPLRHRRDTLTHRREKLLQQIGYGIINRRLQRLARKTDAPFRDAGFGTADIFRTGRSTRLIVDTVDRRWQIGLETAAREYRRALARGFSDAEVAEQLAAIRTALEDAAEAASTRSNAVLAQAALDLVNVEVVPSTPASVLTRFQSIAPAVTPSSVLAALRRDALPLARARIRFHGRVAPAGGAQAIEASWKQAMHAPIDAGEAITTPPFGYSHFGQPGTIAGDVRELQLGIRKVRFANGVMLNLKRTMVEAGKVRVSLAVDGGATLETRENPLATEMVSHLDEGGLGKHSRDELDTILAGHTLSFGLSSGDLAFESRAGTTPRDLELQLQLMAALILDPGYRPEGEIQYRQAINNHFAQLRATPGAALQAELGRILSDGDPRFSLQPVESYRRLNFEKLRGDIADRLAHGAVEIGVVGDIDEDRVIAQVAATFGALPSREPSFRSHPEAPLRMFTRDRSARVVHHTGPADQALLHIVWPSRDDADPVEAMKLEMLERAVRLELTDELRESLGKAYSPSAASRLSHRWKGYGTFSITATPAVVDVALVRAAIARVISRLTEAPVDEDLFRRARQPLAESYDNALKGNATWLSLVGRAQSEPARIERFVAAAGRLGTLTPTDVQAMAKRYLVPAAGLEILVLPDAAGPPPP